MADTVYGLSSNHRTRPVVITIQPIWTTTGISLYSRLVHLLPPPSWSCSNIDLPSLAALFWAAERRRSQEVFFDDDFPPGTAPALFDDGDSLGCSSFTFMIAVLDFQVGCRWRWESNVDVSKAGEGDQRETLVAPCLVAWGRRLWIPRACLNPILQTGTSTKWLTEKL